MHYDFLIDSGLSSAWLRPVCMRVCKQRCSVNVKQYGAGSGWRDLKPYSQKGLFLPFSPWLTKVFWVKTGAKFDITQKMCQCFTNRSLGRKLRGICPLTVGKLALVILDLGKSVPRSLPKRHYQKKDFFLNPEMNFYFGIRRIILLRGKDDYMLHEIVSALTGWYSGGLFGKLIK